MCVPLSWWWGYLDILACAHSANVQHSHVMVRYQTQSGNAGRADVDKMDETKEIANQSSLPFRVHFSNDSLQTTYNPI